MNGKQARSLRKLLEVKKPTEASDSGLYVDKETNNLMFKHRSNPQMNMYRKMKRYYTRGW